MIRFLKCLSVAIFACALGFIPKPASAGLFIGINVGFAPPALPVYVQPPVPAPGLIWTPGYWSYSDFGGYYWVPGAWVAPPQIGYLWTPGYWGFANDVYAWHPGYWGPHVGFYGGVNYGYGYFGSGFNGGGWFGNRYRYNTAYTNVNTTIIHNTYVNRTTIVNNNVTVNRISYNGGPNGVQAQPNEYEREYSRETHLAPTSEQEASVTSASRNRQLLASVNHGRPALAAVERPLTSEHTTDAFSRFDRSRETGITPAATSHVPAYRAPASVDAYPANRYAAPKTFETHNAHVSTKSYAPHDGYATPKTYSPRSSYVAPKTYRPAGASHVTHTYHAEHGSVERDGSHPTR